MTDETLDTSRPFLSLQGIGKRFGGTVAFESIDWSVDAGEVRHSIALLSNAALNNSPKMPGAEVEVAK